MPYKIVLTGAPGTGKTTVLNLIKAQKYCCFDEISRKIIQQAQLEGTLNIFETQPLLFSEQLLKHRLAQFQLTESKDTTFCFLDRGLPDITAYLNYANQTYQAELFSAIDEYIYDIVFVFPPWEQIYTKDQERMETFEQAVEIHKHILKAYQKKHRLIIEVPFDTPENRCKFIQEQINRL